MDDADFLTDLNKWQAYNDPVLAERQPEDIFDAEFAKYYRYLHGNLWQRMIRLHETIVTLEQLEQFPFGYLYSSDEMRFWVLVVRNFFDMAILKLHGLTNDAGVEINSLTSFRRRIENENWTSPSEKGIFQKVLKERKFDRSIQRISQRVDSIRDSDIAHSLIDLKTGGLKQTLGRVTLKDVRQLFNAAHSLFGALSFGACYLTLSGDLMPTTIGGKPTPTCLEGILNAVLRDSDFVNQPEHRGQYWDNDRRYMPAHQLQTMNELRKRIGLREV